MEMESELSLELSDETWKHFQVFMTCRKEFRKWWEEKTLKLGDIKKGYAVRVDNVYVAYIGRPTLKNIPSDCKSFKRCAKLESYSFTDEYYKVPYHLLYDETIRFEMLKINYSIADMLTTYEVPSDIRLHLLRDILYICYATKTEDLLSHRAASSPRQRIRSLIV